MTSTTTTSPLPVECGNGSPQIVTLADAVSRGLVTLTGTGCFTGECITLRVANGGVPAGLQVHVRTGDVFLDRNPRGQNFVNLRVADVCIANGATVESALAVACIDAEKAISDEGQLFDLGPPLPTWAARFGAGTELLRLVETIDELQLWLAPYINRAIWLVTDLRPVPEDVPEVLDLLTTAAVDASNPAGDLPHLTNPTAGSTGTVSVLAAAARARRRRRMPVRHCRCLLRRWRRLHRRRHLSRRSVR